MDRNWTNVGLEYVKKDQREEIGKGFDGAKWSPLPCRLSFSGGMLIHEAIQAMKIRKPTHVFDYHDCPARIGHYGIIGLRATYPNGTANIYFLDLGGEAVVLCTDFYPVENSIPEAIGK